MITFWTNILFLIIDSVFSSIPTKQVTWESIGRSLYYAELNGEKAHSWWDAYNRCSKLTPGNPYPAIFPKEQGIAEYLSRRHAELNINPGELI